MKTKTSNGEQVIAQAARAYVQDIIEPKKLYLERKGTAIVSIAPQLCNILPVETLAKIVLKLPMPKDGVPTSFWIAAKVFDAVAMEIGTSLTGVVKTVTRKKALSSQWRSKAFPVSVQVGEYLTQKHFDDAKHRAQIYSFYSMLAEAYDEVLTG